MVSKNNIQHKMEADAKRVPHYGLRKLGIGVTSVLLGTTLYFGMGNVAIHADTTSSAEVTDSQLADEQSSKSNNSVVLNNTAKQAESTQTKTATDSASASTENEQAASAAQETAASTATASQADNKVAQSADTKAATASSATTAGSQSADEQSQKDAATVVNSTAVSAGTAQTKTTNSNSTATESKQLVRRRKVRQQPLIHRRTTMKLFKPILINLEISSQKLASVAANAAQTDSVTVYATDGTTSLTFNKPNGGVIGQTWDSANGKDNNLELILHLSGAKAGSKIVITIPGADTFTISGTIPNTPVGADTPISIDSQYGTVTTVQQNYAYTITVNITNTVNGTLNLPIYLRHVPNGYKSMPIPLHDPMGDTTKTITWTESVNNGPVQTQDNTGLTFISRQMPSWNPGQNVTDTSNHNGKQFINNSQITYSYAVNEDDGVVASEDGKPNYPAAQVNSAVNFGTTITIPMPKGFVLDQDATNQLIAGWYDDKLPDNPVTIIQDANGNVVITVPKGQGFQKHNNKPAYQFVGHYENITQQDKSFTLYGGNITIEQQLNGTTKYFKSTSKVSDIFYGKNDKIQISNVSDWINAPWKTKKYGNDFIPYWMDQHDQVIAYAGFDNGFVTSLNNSTITFTIPDGLVVHGLRVPKVAGISSYNYTYTLDDGSTHSGTVTAGEEITINDKNRTITSIDLSALTIPAQTETTTAKDATAKNQYDDAEQRYVSQDNTGAFEFIGHLGATKRDGKTKLTMGEILSLNMRLRVPVNDGYQDFLQTTKVEAVTSADTASVIGQCFGAYSSNSLFMGLHMVGGYTLEDSEATSYYIKDPVFYVILPKGFAYGGIMTTSTNPSTPKVSLSNDGQGNTIVKLDYTGQQFDVRKIVNLRLNTMPDITNGTKIISAFVYSPTTALSPEFDHPYSVPATEKSWFAADQQNEHLYNIGNFNSIDITKAVSDLYTTSWAQGNQDLDMSSSQGNAKADGKQNMSFTVWINNGSTYNVTNAKTIINLPTKTTDGKGFDFHLTGPVDYTGNTKVVIKYATQAFNLSKNSTQVGYVPDTTNFVDADQVSDWSRVKSILVEVPSLVSGAVIGRININGVDSNLLYDGGQTGYLGTGLYMAGFMPSVKQQAAQIKIAPAEKKYVSYQFVDDDNNGADVGNPVVVLGEPGSTQSVSLTVPTGYQLASGQALPTSVTIGTDNQTVDIHLVHTVSTATLSGSNQSTYTGSAITVDNLNGGTIKVNVQGANSGQYTLKAGDVEFSSDNGKTWSTTMPTNAGDYQIRLTDQGRQAIEKQYGGNGINWVDANSNSTITGIATYTIDKAKATATIGGSITRKYNGQAVNGTTVYGQITWTGKDTSNNQDFTLKHDISASDYSWYTMGKDGKYVEFDGKPTNAGIYYLILNKDYINKLDQANPNYDITSVDGAFTYTINKAKVNATLSGNPETKTPSLNAGDYTLKLTVDGKQQTIILTNDDLVLSQNGQPVSQLTKAEPYKVNFSQKFIDDLNSTYPSGNYDVNTSSKATFTLDNSSQTINYIDANGKVIGSTTVGSDAIEGTTVPFKPQDHVPAGWVMTDPSAAPTEVTLENGTTTITIQHGTITVRPGEKAPTGKVPGNPNANYDLMEALTKTPTRTIIVAIPGETTPRTITQSVTFERIATYDTVTGKATYSDWTQTGDTKSWAEVDPTLKGYTTIIDNQPGTTIPAVTDITEQTANVTVNVTYVKNAATITITGPAQSKTYDGQEAEITDEIANKISHQISGDSQLTLPDGSQVTLTKDDFSFAGPEGNILTGNPSSVGTYHIVLNKNGLDKIEGLDSNFTWSYDPKTSYVVYTINSAQADSVAFNASATKTYDGSNVLNGASFTTQPSIVIKGADSKPLAGTKGYTFQSGDFEFVDSKGNEISATIDSAGQITGPTNADTYTIQLTQAGLNRIEAANPNVDFTNVKLADIDIGTGTLTINKYAPTLDLSGKGAKTYDGQKVTSAELTKSDEDNNITITFTVPKQGGGKTTVTYTFNPEMDYTGDYDWYENGAQIAAPKNAGTYTIKLNADQVKNIFNDLLSKDANYSYLKGNINTNGLQVSGEATYTIKKKPLKVYLTGGSRMTYTGGGATMPLTDLINHLTADGLVKGETLGTNTFDDADFQWYVQNADGTYSVFNGKDTQGHSVQTPINVGTYYIGILPETSTNSGIDTLQRDNTNYDVTIDYSKYYRFDITKAQGTATLSGNQTDTYNGQAHTINGYTLTVSGTGIQDGQTVTLNAGDLEFNVKGQWTTNVPVNAGRTYQVRLNAAKLAELEKNYPNLAWDNANVTNNALDYVVNPTQVTVSFAGGPSHSTYNGSALSIGDTKDFFQGRFAMNGVVAGQTLNFPEINNEFFEWVDANGNVMTSVPTNAGTYTLKVKDLNELKSLNPNYQLVFGKDANGNDQNGWTWIIDKATARITFTSGSQTTPWTGKATVLDPNNFAVTITTDNGQTLTSDALTVDDFQFYNQAGQAIATPTEVGNYTIKLNDAGLAKIEKDTANYKWTNNASGNYEITKAAAKIKLDGNSSMTYNGQAASFPVNADGSLNGYTVTLSYTLKPGDLRFSTMVTGADGKSYLEVTNAPVNAGTYDVTLSDNGLANINKVDGNHYQYTLDSSTATFTINKADATIAINGSGKHTYDGQAAKTSEGNYTIQLPGQSTTTNVAADNLVFVDANGKVITAPTDAGTYTIALSDAYKQSLQGTYGNNYNLKYTNGTFTVAPKVVDLILNGTASQFYDGQPAKITDVSGLTLTWGDHTTTTAPGGVQFTLTPDDLEVVDGQGNVPTKANEADQATNPYYIKLKDAVLAGLNSQNNNYTFKIGDTYARYTIFANKSNVKLTGKQFVNYGDNPMPAINIQDGNFKLTWTDVSRKDQDITLTADDLTVEVPDGVSKDKYGLPTKAGQYVVKLKQGVIDKLNKENPNYRLSNDPNTNAWYVVKHRQVSFTINGTPNSTYNGQAAQIKDGDYTISFGPVSGNQNSGVLSDDQSAFDGIKWDAGDFEFVNGAPTNAGTYQVRLSKTGLQKLSEFAQGATGSNYDFSSVATIENGQITASSVTANYIINKNQLEINLTNKNGQVLSSIIGDYNLNAGDYTLTITPNNTTVYGKDGKPLSFTYKLQNDDVFYVKGLPSNVGTYSVQLTAEALQKIEQQFGTDNFDYKPSTSASREITQGNAVITVSGGQTVYYNGKPAVLRHKKYQVTVSTDFFSTGVPLNKGDMAKMVFYIKNADGSYTELTDESGKPVKPTNAGTYYVGLNSDMVKMREDATGNEGQNYKWTFSYAPYVIKSVNRTAIGSFSNNSDYNGKAIAPQTITVTTKYPGATNTTYILQKGDYEYVKDGQVVASPTDAGTYTIRLTTAGENHIKQLGNVEGAEENNVNWTIQFTGSYTINQVRMTVTVNGTQNETYDGTAKTINIVGKNGINVTLSDDGLTVPTIPTTGENALTAADFTIKDAAGNIVTNSTNAGHYKVYLNASGLAKLAKLSPNFTVPASLDQAGDLDIARKEVNVTEGSAWKTFDAKSAALTDDQFAHYKDAIINAGKDAGIKDGYSVDGLTIDGINWWFDDTVDYGTQGSMKNPIKDIGIYNLRLNAKGQQELDAANPNYKIKVGDFQYHIYPEVVHIELSGNQDANWDNQPVPVNPTNFVPKFVVYGGPNGKNPGPDDKPLKNPVRDDGQTLTLPEGVQLEPGDYEFVDAQGNAIKNFTRADGTTSTNPFKVGTYYVRLTEAGWKKLAILSTDNVHYQYDGSTGTLNINSITPQFKLNGQNWKTYDGQPVSYKELTSVDPTTKQPLITVSIISNGHTITFPLNDGDYVWSANGQALTSAPTNVGTYTITLNKDKVMKSLQNFISSNSDYQGAMNILADNIGGSALFEIKALQIANITAAPSSGSKTYDGTAAQIDLSTLAKSIKATTGSGKNEKVWSLNTSNLTLAKDYTVTDAKGNVVTDFPINAGTYTFKLNDQGIKDLAAANTNFTIPSEINGYSYIFTINPVEAKAVLSGQAAKTYDGNQVTTAEINAGTSTVTVSINANKTVTYVLQDGDYIWYVKNADGSWTKLDKAPIDAGTYKVELNNDAVLAHLREKIADDPEWTVGDIHNVFLNDSDLSGSAEFTIKKKPVTLIISGNPTSTADPTVDPQKITVSGDGITISNLHADDFQLQDADGNVVDPKTAVAGKYLVALTPAAQAAIQNDKQYSNYQFRFMGTGSLNVQAKLTINFIDTDEGNKVIQTSTKSGDAGTPLSLSLTLPAGYQLADGQTLPTSYQFTDALTQTLNINLKHATQSVEDSKTVTRTINYTDPTTGEVKTLTTQPVTLTRTGSTDLVTHKTTWQDWTTGNWAAISANDIPTFAGYTPSQTSVAAETVTDQTNDSTVNITYTADPQSVTIRFVDDNENGKQVGDLIPKQGVTDQTIDNLDLTVPDHYVLASGQTLPTSYTFTAAKDQTITIHLVHATKIIDGKNPATIPSDVDKKQLIHTVTRTITDNVPGEAPIVTPQTATITRSATYDEVTGKLSNYSDWTKASLGSYTVNVVAGYTTGITETKNGKETVIDSIPELPLSSTTPDSTIEITYTANEQSMHIIYQDAAGNVVKTNTVSGKTDQTVDTNSSLPTGWKIAETSTVKAIPSTITFKGASTPDTVIVVEHVMTPVDHTKPVAPGAKTVTGKVIDGAHEVDLNKTITRTINITDPHTGLSTQTQTVKLFRNAKYDEVTGEVTYYGWNTGNWAEVTVPTVDGYTPSQTSVAAETVTDQTNDSTVNITYSANKQTGKISYQDKDGKEISTTPLSGKTDETVAINPQAPTGWKITDGQDIPKTVTATADGVPTVVVKIEHATTKVPHDKPLQPGAKTPTGKVINGAHEADLNQTITRTINVTTPDGKTTTTTQVAKIYRDATYDDVTGEVTYGAWSTAWAEFKPAKLAGYTASEADVSAVEVKNGQKDVTINVAYTANDQSAKIIYQDQAGKVIKTDTVNGKTNQTVKVSSTLPTGWKLSKGQTVPSEITFGPNGHADITVKVEHAMTKVPHDKPLQPGAKTPTGKVIDGAHDADLNKTIIRTINVKTPNGKTTTTKQVANLYRDATYDDVTGEVAYDDWSTDTWKAFTPTAIPGYTVETVPMETVTADMSNKTVNVAYTADKQTVMIKFVDDNENGKQVGELIPKQGVTDQTITDFSNVKVPEYYQLAKNSSLPTSYTFTAAKDQTITIHLVHATKTVDGKDPATIPSGVDKNQLIHMVTRTITDNVPGQNPIITKQTATITRRATYDEVTGKLSNFSDWTTAELPGYTAKGAAGYTPSQSELPAEAVISTTEDSSVDITYTAGEQTVTIKFVDDNNGGQPVTSVTKAGQTGETINQLGLTMPTHYELAKGQILPTSYTFTAEKDQTITIHLIHATKTVDGNKPDTIPSDVDKKQLIHTVTRTITDHVPGQEPLITKQSATITRRATYDEVTGKLSNFSDWTTAELPGYTAKGAAGYTASETDVPAETVTSDTKDEVISITYTANTQTGKISYQDQNGKEIDSTSLSGKTGETVTVTPQIPAGWKIVAGQNIPMTVIATADGIPTVVVKIEHATTSVDHKDPLQPGAKTPTGKVIDGAHEADLNQTITRTINVTTPDGKTTTTTQVAKIYRDATYDNVTGEVTYGKWSTDTWKAFTPTAIPGYTVETVPVVEVKNGQKDVTVNVTYTAKNIQNIIKYVDENGNVVKTDHVTGKLGDPIKVTIPAGYHVDGGNIPTLTIGDGAKSVQTVHVIKDQHNTDDPTVDHKDVLNIIKYVDENGKVVKVDHVTGKLGDPITLTIPDGYHVAGGQLPRLVIIESGVQIVNIERDQHGTDTPTINDKPTDDHSKLHPGSTTPAQQLTEAKGAESAKNAPLSEATTSGSKQSAQQLPQTGNARHESGLAALGLALLGLIGLVPKKRRHDN